MMNKFFKYILLVPFLLIGCNNDDDTNCSFNDPTRDLTWLSEKIIEIENTSGDLLNYFYISQATYQENVFARKKTVFIFPNCCPVCSSVVPVYSCEGELLGVVGTGDNSIHSDFLNDVKIIWSPENFACLIATD